MSSRKTWLKNRKIRPQNRGKISENIKNPDKKSGALKKIKNSKENKFLANAIL